MKWLSLVLAVLLAFSAAAFAQPGSIYWMTEPQDCSVGWGAPMWSAWAAPCMAGSLHLSICPGTNFSPAGDPYNTGQPITITGISATHILSNNASSGYFVIGSAHVGVDGPDVFLTGGGIGTHSVSKALSAPFPQGISGAPGAHIDIYASCVSGQHQFLLEIDYTSP